jgi:hypothetical protein
LTRFPYRNQAASRLEKTLGQKTVLRLTFSVMTLPLEYSYGLFRHRNYAAGASYEVFFHLIQYLRYMPSQIGIDCEIRIYENQYEPGRQSSLTMLEY